MPKHKKRGSTISTGADREEIRLARIALDQATKIADKITYVKPPGVHNLQKGPYGPPRIKKEVVGPRLVSELGEGAREKIKQAQELYRQGLYNQGTALIREMLKDTTTIARERPGTVVSFLAFFTIGGGMLANFLIYGVKPTLQALKEMYEYFEIYKKIYGENLVNATDGGNTSLVNVSDLGFGSARELIADTEKVLDNLINLSQGENIIDSVKELSNLLNKHLNLNIPKFENIESLANIATSFFNDDNFGQDVPDGSDILRDTRTYFDYKKQYRQEVLVPDILMRSSIQRAGGTTLGIGNSGATESTNKIKNVPRSSKVTNVKKGKKNSKV